MINKSVYSLLRGMNDAMSPHLVRDGESAYIKNLHLSDDGSWKNINIPDVELDLSGTLFDEAVKVFEWKPANVPADCGDDFVYVVFYSDGRVRLVYRGDSDLAVFTILIKARQYGTATYLALPITNVTQDNNGDGNGTTSVNVAEAITRVYFDGSQFSATCPLEVEGEGESTLAFYRWVLVDNTYLSNNRVLGMAIDQGYTIIAEYVIAPYIRVEDSSHVPIGSLDKMYALYGEYSNPVTYYVGGIGLTADLSIYVDEENFELSLDGTNWVDYGSAISIPYATANAGMTAIHVRYYGGV